MAIATRLEDWSPDSWQRKTTLQQPVYRDRGEKGSWLAV